MDWLARCARFNTIPAPEATAPLKDASDPFVELRIGPPLRCAPLQARNLDSSSLSTVWLKHCLEMRAYLTMHTQKNFKKSFFKNQNLLTT